MSTLSVLRKIVGEDDRRLAEIEFEHGNCAIITQSDDGEVRIWLSSEDEPILRTRDIDEAASWVGGMVFSDHYAPEDAD